MTEIRSFCRLHLTQFECKCFAPLSFGENDSAMTCRVFRIVSYGSQNVVDEAVRKNLLSDIASPILLAGPSDMVTSRMAVMAASVALKMKSFWRMIFYDFNAQ